MAEYPRFPRVISLASPDAIKWMELESLGQRTPTGFLFSATCTPSVPPPTLGSNSQGCGPSKDLSASWEGPCKGPHPHRPGTEETKPCPTQKSVGGSIKDTQVWLVKRGSFLRQLGSHSVAYEWAGSFRKMAAAKARNGRLWNQNLRAGVGMSGYCTQNSQRGP